MILYFNKNVQKNQQQESVKNQRSIIKIKQGMIKIIQGYSYNVTQSIGGGYSSTVHRGQHQSTGQKVSFKVIQMNKLQDPINQMLLQHQVSALKQLKNSPNILQLYDIYATKNNTYIITQLCDGDLATLIKQKKQFPYYEAIKIVTQIIKAIIEVHQKGYIHRDIKPANIFYKNNEYKLGDFGFAIPINKAIQHRYYNVGSPVYMPPQALKENIFTTSCDIWATGVIMFQLLKGMVPWIAINQKQLYQKIISEPIDRLSEGLPEIVRQFLGKVLNVNPEKRMSIQQLKNWPEKFNSVRIKPTHLQFPQSSKSPLQKDNLVTMNYQNNRSTIKIQPLGQRKNNNFTSQMNYRNEKDYLNNTSCVENTKKPNKISFKDFPKNRGITSPQLADKQNCQKPFSPLMSSQQHYFQAPQIKFQSLRTNYRF